MPRSLTLPRQSEGGASLRDVYQGYLRECEGSRSAEPTQAEIDRYNWRLHARPAQLPPPGEYDTWAHIGGRGSGKTRGGAEWARDLIEVHDYRHLAFVAPTAADARDTMVLGKESGSGILDVCPPWNMPEYFPSKRVVVWPSGAMATLYSAEKPGRLNGPQHWAAWGDEPGVWDYGQDTVDMLLFGLRLGPCPLLHCTSTPKPAPWFRDFLLGPKDDITGQRIPPEGVVLTHSETDDNAANLSGVFLKRLTSRYGGTRLEEQERRGRFLEDVEGALWNQDSIDRHRVHQAPQLDRIVVAVDPAVTKNRKSNETGIVVAGKVYSPQHDEDHFFVLDDRWSGKLAPLEWARGAWDAYDEYEADRITHETNQGGDLVPQNLATARGDYPVSVLKNWGVRAARGKRTRAEPVSSLSAQGRLHMVGSLPKLESQLTTWEPDKGQDSPDRLDAMVWAVTELMGGAAVDTDSIGRALHDTRNIGRHPLMDVEY